MSTSSSSPTVWPTDFAYKKALRSCEQNYTVTASYDKAVGSVIVFRPKIREVEDSKVEIEAFDFEDYKDGKTKLGVTTEFHQNDPPLGTELDPDA